MRGKKPSQKEYKDAVAKISNGTIRVLGIYTKAIDPITHICSSGHKWKGLPYDILRGRGCGKCFYNSRRRTQESYEREVKKVSSGNIRVVGRYRSSMTHVEHKCVTCKNNWSAVPNSILHAKSGCPYCVQARYSKSSIIFLKKVAKKIGMSIRHAANGGEVRIPGTRFFVDGLVAGTKIIIEFNGDAYHGNPFKFKDEDCCHPFLPKVTAGELYIKTRFREVLLQLKGLM